MRWGSSQLFFSMDVPGATRLPMVVIIENNQYAISVPIAEEVAGQVADRALGYGMHGVAVDGNDPLAVHVAITEALERARTGGGPTLIEAVTYRLMMHTTSDDPKKYRTDDEVESCLRELVREWRFPFPTTSADVHVNLPFVFGP